MRFAIVIEKSGSTYSAYVPDLPGCAATAREVNQKIRRAIRFHVEGLRESSRQLARLGGSDRKAKAPARRRPERWLEVALPAV